MVTKTIKKKIICGDYFVSPILESLPVAKKNGKHYSTKRLQRRFLIAQHIEKALRRGVADFLKCDWLAFLR